MGFLLSCSTVACALRPVPSLPSLTALLLRDGCYTELAVVRGDECLAAAPPFPVSVVPNDLLR